MPGKNERNVRHLLRRTEFIDRQSRVDELMGLTTFADIVDNILGTAANPLPSPPSVVFQNTGEDDNWRRGQELAHFWFDRMANDSPRPMQEKMACFWHGHLVSELGKVGSAELMREQIDLYRRDGLDNFRDMVTEMSTQVAMLRYLDNNRKEAASPNQNFARELMELFLLEVGNYTEADVEAARSEERYQRQFQTVRNLSASSTDFWNHQIGQAFVDQLEVASEIAPAIPEELPSFDLVARLEVQARLINANLGFRVLSAGWGDFDSHAGQPDQHPLRMQELNAAIRRFYEVLDPAWTTRVTFITFSEFGRTSQSNDGAGTDHGTTAPYFVFGSNVQGGLYGERPTLAGLGRWGCMAHHVDFRDYYGSVIDGWLGGRLEWIPSDCSSERRVVAEPDGGLVSSLSHR